MDDNPPISRLDRNSVLKRNREPRRFLPWRVTLAAAYITNAKPDDRARQVNVI